jgi:hypothetical protein
MTISIGQFTIYAATDSDGHLTLWVTSVDGSPVHDIGADIGELGEFAVRLTTGTIETFSEVPV